jgi:hypothetical protein
MADWRDSANRALSLLEGYTSGEGSRTKCIIDHVLATSRLSRVGRRSVKNTNSN